MADNVTLNVGAGGKIIASDDVGGAHHQWIKLMIGADGTVNPVSATYPMPINNPNLEIARGNVTGMSSVHKFGEAGDLDSEVADVWDGCSNITGLTKTSMLTYTYSSTADIDSLSSSSGSDTTDVEVQGLDATWALVTQTITLTGQTRVALDTDLIRVFRMKNVGATAFAGNVFCYVNGAITAGVPDTEADVRAIMQIGNEQTLMAIYTIPLATTGYLCQFFASVSGTGGGTKDAQIDLRFRKTGGVFQLKHRTSVLADGTSHFGHPFAIPETGLPAKTDIVITATSASSNLAISGGFDIILIDD